MNQPLFVEMNLQVTAALGSGVPRIGLGPVASVEKIGVGGGWSTVKKKLMGRKLSFFRVRASFSGSSTSRLGLDPETFQPQESSKMLWIGPVPGDISEVEAYCRIFRAAEKLNTAVMRTICNPETGECTAPYDISSENLSMLEEKVVTVLGSMLPLLNRGREEILSGRSSLANTYRDADLSVMESRLPPLAVFRGDMKRCCESLHVALANYLTPLDDRSADIWKKMQRLKNVCYDAGFPRGEGHPSPTVFANWSPVCLSNKKEEMTGEDCEVAFWKGGQVTAEGLNWLLDKRFKTIVDLRNDVVVDKYYQTAIDHAISHGKIELVTMPVEVGTAPSMEQVRQFAGLVSDLSKQPIYLHSQEGVSRTSAMVSRWKQYIGRLLSRSTSNKTNLKGAFEEGSKVKSHQNYDSSKKGVELPSNENGSHINDLVADVSVAPIGAKNANGDSSGIKINGVTKSSDGEVVEESNFGIVKGVNPLKSQIPTVDIFSRKEMTRFFKHQKVSPQTFLDSQSERFRNRIIFRGGATVPVKNFGTNLAAQSSESTKPEKTNGAYAGSMQPSNVIDYNEHKKYRNEHSPSSVDKGEIYNFPKSPTSSKVNGQVLSIDDQKMISNGTSNPIDGSADLVEGNMCASTTGVVRIQSRKKAEMFLVRTDGVSCSREKVTESSLAFTHPSTQQQMLMWKSPPKTVLLLKKLGNELMEEAKEVTSFLHHQEKMNILVEPDVHDMFARIPGFGFVQTFYSQDISDLHERVDFVACLGGDGVILHASNLFKGAVPPVVSFNLGSLGFLTSHTFEDYMQDLRSVIHGNNTLGVYITLRMRLQCQVFRKGQAVPGKIFDVLNEVVVDRGSNPYISKIECYEHMRLITKVQGDGDHALHGKEDKEVEIKLKTFGSEATKKAVYVIVNACSSKDHAENIVGVCFIGQDITGQKVVMDKFTQIQGDYKTVVHSPNPLIPPIFASDENTCCSEWNMAMEKLTGCSEQEIKGKLLVGEVFGGLCRLKGPDALTKFMIVLHNAILGKEIEKFPFSFFNKNGTFVQALLTANPRSNMDGKVVGVFCFLQIASPELQQGMEMQKQLEKKCLERIKELAYICWEIKNPLSGIRFVNSMLEGTDMSNEQKQLLETSIACEKQAFRIVQNMDCINNGSMELEKNDFVIGNVISVIVSQVMILLRERGLELIRDIPEEIKLTTVYGDQVRLQQCLSGFLLNMVRCSPSNGWVEIQVKPTVEKASDGLEFVHLQFRMVCPGPGLPSELVQDMFSKDHCSTTQEGLGLNMCMKIVKLMNGQVQYIRESERCYFDIVIKFPFRSKWNP